MGYTHSFTPKKATPEKWNEFVQQCKQLKDGLQMYSESACGCYEDKKILIRGGGGTGRAIFNKEEVWFNGDTKRGLEHETFWTEPNLDEWQFCKTARKPYDLLVCAVLIAAKNILGYEVTSNGNLEDWKQAIDLYSEVIYGESIYTFDDVLIEYILPEFLSKEILK